MSETVHVLLPVHNRSELTRRFLRCLRSQTYPRIRVLVIDDGSRDATAAVIEAEYPAAHVLHGDGRWWWAGCLQEGFDWLRSRQIPDSDLVLIANDDTTFDADYIERAVAFLRGRSRCLLCSQLRDPLTGVVRQSGVEADLRRFAFRVAEDPSRINCLPTRGLFLRWGDMRRIGGFHRHLLPHYWSDYEYTLRAHRLGFACLTDSSVAVTANADSTGERDLDRLVGWTFVRSLFSIRTPLNPVYRTSFVLFACPGAWKFINVFNVWGRALARIAWQGVVRRPFPRERGMNAAAPSPHE
ncbi:MAG TPA: glycosyltransferase [Burkholderiales bacterium]|nr:glycosyltransferase [Burkholderiales bacterium]